MTDIETVKGFRDFLPPESLKREAVKEIIKKWFKLYGFLPVETPIVEFDELMRQEKKENEKENDEDEAISDRFRLKDRGNRELGLRYEFTFQLARLLKLNPNIKLPFKRYQIGPVFRDEPVSSNRFRQFTQCDADIIGDLSVNADAEVLSLFSEILNELKIKTEIEINNRKLLNAIIESVQIDQIKEVMKELDKVTKIGLDQVKVNLRKITTTNQIITLFRLLEKDIDFFKENAFAGIEELEELIENCKDYGVKVKFNPFLVRGFAYYTGNIFEITSADENVKGSIAAGGRYDKTVGKYLFRDIPAVGCSFGLERVTDIANIKIEPPIKALLISISQDSETIKLSKTLRKSLIPSIISFDKPGKAMEYANAMNIPYVVFVGEEEISKKKYKLKNMQSGKESFLTENSLIRQLK